MLKVMLDVLVDYLEKYSIDDREELISKANLMSPSILAGTTTRKSVSDEWIKSAGAIIGIAAITAVISSTGIVDVVSDWLSKTLVSIKDKSKK